MIDLKTVIDELQKIKKRQNALRVMLTDIAVGLEHITTDKEGKKTFAHARIYGECVGDPTNPLWKYHNEIWPE